MKLLLLLASVLSAGGAWTSVFFDDFSAPTLDPALWTVRDNMTHGTREWQLYMADEVYLEGGALVIRTRSRNASYGAREYKFTSGWVDTRGHALGENTFGMFSARIQLPFEAVGVWPAYWLVDDNNHCWPTGAEIDILESVGSTHADSISGTYPRDRSQWAGAHRGNFFSSAPTQHISLPPPFPTLFSPPCRNVPLGTSLWQRRLEQGWPAQRAFSTPARLALLCRLS